MFSIPTLLIALTLLSGAGDVGARASVRTAAQASHSASPHAPEIEAGSIRGRVISETASRRPRRRARRYAGGTATPVTPQSLPTIVWIEGALPSAALGPITAELPQRDTAFVPSFVTVPVGGTVRFPNEDPFFHNVFSYTSGSRFDLGAYPRGESREVTFDQPGLVRVFCEVHDQMRAAILVVENPFHAVVSAEGEFAFDDVPEGRWTIVAWNAARGEERVEVEVRDGAVAEVEIPLG